MDYGKSFTFAFEDKEWIRKLGFAGLIMLGSALLFVFPAIFFISGYLMRTARNVIEGKKEPLPDLDNVGEMFLDGFKIFVATFVYALPIVVLSLAFIPALIALDSGGGDVEAILGTFGGLLYCLIVIYGLFIGLLAPAIYVQYLRGGSTIGAALNFGQVIGIFREHLVPCLLFLLVSIGAQFAVQIISFISIITICGPIVVGLLGGVWTYAVMGHVTGQFYLEVEGGGSISEKTPEDLVY